MCAHIHAHTLRARRGLGRDSRKAAREFLASKHSSFVTAPADVHVLTWALAKFSAAAANAKPEHIPQESALFKRLGQGALSREIKRLPEKKQKSGGECAENRGHRSDSRGTGESSFRARKSLQNSELGIWGMSLTKIITIKIILTTGPTCVAETDCREK